MSSHKDALLKAAEIARLELNEHEQNKFTKQLDEVLEAFEKLDEIDDKDTVSTVHVSKSSGKLREDKAEQTDFDAFCCADQKLIQDKRFVGPRLVRSD